jgi:hypothetical protein
MLNKLTAKRFVDTFATVDDFPSSDGYRRWADDGEANNSVKGSRRLRFSSRTVRVGTA